MNPDKPFPTENARVFVVIEFVVFLVVGLMGGILGGVGWWLGWWGPFGAAALLVFGTLQGTLFWIILMLYRLSTWLVGFMAMAELLDATRILLESTFAPLSRGPK